MPGSTRSDLLQDAAQNMTKRIDVIVSGRVQGVAFRWHTLQKAREMGIFGSVRNLPDGTVAIVAEGETGPLQRFMAWLGQGPAHARVVSTEVHWSEARGEYTDFIILG